jgi:hypothetical protein
MAFGGLAERDHAGIQAVNQRAEREKVQSATLANFQSLTHFLFL